MTREEIKSEIVENLLGYLSKKSILELSEKICESYLEGDLDNLDEIICEVEEEIAEKYNVQL